ncbi:MAG: hypothetical protein ACK5CA_03745 [Cyanobacteriota bacterium]
MSKYEELCQAYAQAHSASREAMTHCQAFAQKFVAGLATYLDCQVQLNHTDFEESGSMYFYPALTLYLDPRHPQEEQSEIVVVSIALETLGAGYHLTLYPWEQSFELQDREPLDATQVNPIYQFIFEQIRDAYVHAAIPLNAEGGKVRNLGWDV